MSDARERARRLMANACLDMTRLKPKLRKACSMVLLDRITPARAALRVKLPRQNVYRAIIRVRKCREQLITDYPALADIPLIPKPKLSMSRKK